MPGNAVLFSEMTPDTSWEDEFNDWYDQEHIPLRTAVPGFRSARRYRVEGKPNYLVVYEMDSPAVLKSPAYLSVKNNPSDRTRRMLSSVTGFTRYIAQQTGMRTRGVNPADGLDAPYLHSVFFEVPPEGRIEFNDWYEKEHIPLLLKSRDWLLVRRFEVVDGEPKSWTHLALHYLKDASVLESLEFLWQSENSVHHKYGSRHNESSQTLYIR